MYFQKLAQFLGFLKIFLCFFLFSSIRESHYKVETGYQIALKFGTQIRCVRAHLGTKFGQNTINTRNDICDYSHKITPILCCNAHRINHLQQEAENLYKGRLTIKPQTFRSLKEIEIITIKIKQKNQQCKIIMQSRITISYLSVSALTSQALDGIHRWLSQFEVLTHSLQDS